MGRFFKRVQRWIYLGPAFVAVLLCSNAFGQTMDNTRLSMNQYVRDLVMEPDTTYLRDSTLNRILNLSNVATMLALGGATNIDTQVVICSAGKMRYTLNSNAIQGSVEGVARFVETAQGGGRTGFIEIDISQIGQLGEGVIPNSYAIQGDQLFLGTRPLSSDTLEIYYAPRANALDADTSAVTLSTEDQPALVFLSAAMFYARDHQIQLAQMYLGLWSRMVGVKGGAPAAPAGGGQ